MMTAEDDIAFIESIYPEFVAEANSKIKDFFDGKYNTFIVDTCDEAWVRRDFVQKNLKEIGEFYAFVRLIDEIRHLRFIEEIRTKAGEYGFSMDRGLVEAYGSKQMLALDLALHFPLWGRETYTNHEFRTLGFSHQTQRGGVVMIDTGVVSILKITVGEGNNLQSIEPYEFRIIRMGLRTVFRRD